MLDVRALASTRGDREFRAKLLKTKCEQVVYALRAQRQFELMRRIAHSPSPLPRGSGNDAFFELRRIRSAARHFATIKSAFRRDEHG